MLTRMGEACASYKPKPRLGTYTRINVNVALSKYINLEHTG